MPARCYGVTLLRMKAREVIDQIMALPPEEQAKVIDFIDEVKASQRLSENDDKNFNDAAKWAFTEHRELMRKLSQ